MTPERVSEIYEGLGALVVALDSDPKSRGPGYLQEAIAQIRGYLNTSSFYLTEVLRERHQTELALEAMEAAFQVRSDELMAEDKRVRSLPSIDDRKSMVNLLLRDDLKEIRVFRRELKNLGHVERVVRHRHKELDNTMSAIRLQKSLIETELRTGSFLGDTSDTSRGGLGSPRADELSPEEVDRLIGEAEAGLTDHFTEAAEATEGVEETVSLSAEADLNLTEAEMEDLLTEDPSDPSSLESSGAESPVVGKSDEAIIEDFFNDEVSLDTLFDSV